MYKMFSDNEFSAEERKKFDNAIHQSVTDNRKQNGKAKRSKSIEERRAQVSDDFSDAFVDKACFSRCITGFEHPLAPNIPYNIEARQSTAKAFDPLTQFVTKSKNNKSCSFVDDARDKQLFADASNNSVITPNFDRDTCDPFNFNSGVETYKSSIDYSRFDSILADSRKLEDKREKLFKTFKPSSKLKSKSLAPSNKSDLFNSPVTMNSQFYSESYLNQPAASECRSYATVVRDKNILTKYAIEIIPRFSGISDKLDNFVGLCYEARKMVPTYTDYEFVTLVRTRLTGQAQAMVLGQNFNNFSELIKYLKSIFSPCRDFIEISGALENLYQDPEETVLAYSARVKELARGMFEESANLCSSMSDMARQDMINVKVTEKFINGLLRDLRAGVRTRSNLDQAVLEAVREEKQYLRDKLLTSSLHEALKPGKGEKETKNYHTVFSFDEICQVCDKTGHSALQCPVTIAQTAAKIANGHSADSYWTEYPHSGPPNLIFHDTENVVCNCCNQTGHTAQDCKQLDQLVLICNQTSLSSIPNASDSQQSKNL